MREQCHLCLFGERLHFLKSELRSHFITTKWTLSINKWQFCIYKTLRFRQPQCCSQVSSVTSLSQRGNWSCSVLAMSKRWKETFSLVFSGSETGSLHLPCGWMLSPRTYLPLSLLLLLTHLPPWSFFYHNSHALSTLILMQLVELSISLGRYAKSFSLGEKIVFYLLQSLKIRLNFKRVA